LDTNTPQKVIKLNKDGTPRKPWTPKNPRKKVAKEKYHSTHISLTDEQAEYLKENCGGTKKAGRLFRELLKIYMTWTEEQKAGLSDCLTFEKIKASQEL